MYSAKRQLLSTTGLSYGQDSQGDGEGVTNINHVFLRAVRAGNQDRVMELLHQGIDINYCNQVSVQRQNERMCHQQTSVTS